jgi:hypothetical protein
MKPAFYGTIVIMALFGLNELAKLNPTAAWCYAMLLLVTGSGAIAQAVRKYNEELDKYID